MKKVKKKKKKVVVWNAETEILTPEQEEGGSLVLSLLHTSQHRYYTRNWFPPLSTKQHLRDLKAQTFSCSLDNINLFGDKGVKCVIQCKWTSKDGVQDYSVLEKTSHFNQGALVFCLF